VGELSVTTCTVPGCLASIDDVLRIAQSGGGWCTVDGSWLCPSHAAENPRIQVLLARLGADVAAARLREFEDRERAGLTLRQLLPEKK